MSNVPVLHKGLQYHEFLARLSRIINARCYLEVGVGQGTTLAKISADHAVAVDPVFALCENIARNKKTLSLHQTSSDEFFSNQVNHLHLRDSVDLAFLDGMHLFEFLLRDFIQTEKLVRDGACVTLHDCLPLNSTMTMRDDQQSILLSRGTMYEGWWTGDVWKMIPMLVKYRPDLEVSAVDCPPTGLVCIKNLDPSSRVLEENYGSIVKEFAEVESCESALTAFYASVTIRSSAEILENAACF